MNSGGKKSGQTPVSTSSISSESILFCPAPFFGSEGWGFKSLRARQISITYPPYTIRFLADVKGKEMLEGGIVITIRDIQAFLKSNKLELRRGDVVLINTPLV
jgi:hypothetical protein